MVEVVIGDGLEIGKYEGPKKLRGMVWYMLLTASEAPSVSVLNDWRWHYDALIEQLEKYKTKYKKEINMEYEVIDKPDLSPPPPGRIN